MMKFVTTISAHPQVIEKAKFIYETLLKNN